MFDNKPINVFSYNWLILNKLTHNRLFEIIQVNLFINNKLDIIHANLLLYKHLQRHIPLQIKNG